jgi:hypothetical protein
MEERATKIGKPKFFYYISPNNGKWLNATDATAVEAMGLGDHVLSDMHVRAGGGVKVAEKLFEAFPGKTLGAANAETNDGTHTMLRASKEAEDLNAWFNCNDVDGTGDFCKRLKFRTASFCNERSGHFDAFDQVCTTYCAFDQVCATYCACDQVCAMYCAIRCVQCIVRSVFRVSWYTKRYPVLVEWCELKSVMRDVRSAGVVSVGMAMRTGMC